METAQGVQLHLLCDGTAHPVNHPAEFHACATAQERPSGGSAHAPAQPNGISREPVLLLFVAEHFEVRQHIVSRINALEAQIFISVEDVEPDIPALAFARQYKLSAG